MTGSTEPVAAPFADVIDELATVRKERDDLQQQLKTTTAELKRLRLALRRKTGKAGHSGTAKKEKKKTCYRCKKTFTDSSNTRKACLMGHDWEDARIMAKFPNGEGVLRTACCKRDLAVDDYEDACQTRRKRDAVCFQGPHVAEEERLVDSEDDECWSNRDVLSSDGATQTMKEWNEGYHPKDWLPDSNSPWPEYCGMGSDSDCFDSDTWNSDRSDSERSDCMEDDCFR